MSTETWLWLEPMRWVVGFLGCTVVVAVCGVILGVIAPPVRGALLWAEKYLFYGVWRSGLYHCARTHKLLVGAIGFIMAGILAFRLGGWLMSTDFGVDFTVTPCLLALALWLLGVGLIIAAFMLLCIYFGRGEDPYASARQAAQEVFSQLEIPVFGRGGRASLQDLRDAGHYKD